MSTSTAIPDSPLTACQFREIRRVCNFKFMGWRERFRHRFDELKRSEGLTQEKLAEQIGVTQGTIAHWLNGRRSPDRLEDYESLAKAIGLHPAMLLYGSNPDITEDAAQFAMEWQKLPPGERAAFREAVRQIGNRSALPPPPKTLSYIKS